MKKTLFLSALVALICSCKNDEGFTPATDREIEFVESFEKSFGKVPENQNWDFYGDYVKGYYGASSASTRASGEVHVNRHDRQQTSIDKKVWEKYLPENGDNRSVGTHNFELISPANGHMEVYAVWYAGWFEQYAKYKFECGIEVNGVQTKMFEGKGDTSTPSSDPSKWCANPGFGASVVMDPTSRFRLYIKYVDDGGKTVCQYSDEGYASLVCTYDFNANKRWLVIGFEDQPESKWSSGSKPDFNDVVLYILGADQVPLLESKRFFCEDMGSIGDFDYNDLVFDVHPIKDNKIEVKVLAIGGTFPIELSVAGRTIMEDGETDLHKIFGTDYVQFNVGGRTMEPKTFVIDGKIDNLASFTDVVARVTDKEGKRIIRYNPVSSKGEAIVAVPVHASWMKEKENIRKGYPSFFKGDWYNYPVEKYLVDIQ